MVQTESDLDKVWVSVTKTVNLGNYENIKIDMGHSTSVGPDENPDEIRMNICRILLEDLIEICSQHEKKKGGRN